jgi:hypothetical protein
MPDVVLDLIGKESIKLCPRMVILLQNIIELQPVQDLLTKIIRIAVIAIPFDMCINDIIDEILVGNIERTKVIVRQRIS